jgi:hypothetical protein
MLHPATHFALDRLMATVERQKFWMLERFVPFQSNAR